MAANANIATTGEDNPSPDKTGLSPSDGRDKRDDSAYGESGPDAAILGAWASYLTWRDTLDALPDDKATVDEQAAFEAPYWAECDKAEAAILEAKATTPAGVAVKLKIALAHTLADRKHDAALRRGDLAALVDPELDWSERVLVSALQSLESMGA